MKAYQEAVARELFHSLPQSHGDKTLLLLSISNRRWRKEAHDLYADQICKKKYISIISATYIKTLLAFHTLGWNHYADFSRFQILIRKMIVQTRIRFLHHSLYHANPLANHAFAFGAAVGSFAASQLQGRRFVSV